MQEEANPQAGSPAVSGSIHGLKEREIAILKLICLEHTSAEIAEKVHLSARTVEGIRTRMIKKTGSRSVIGLVKFALRNGLAE